VSAAVSREESLLAATARLRRRAGAHRRWTTITIGVGAVIIGSVVLVSLAAPLLGIPHPDRQDLLATLRPPSLAHPFGTDPLGRDVFARVVYAARLDLAVAVATTYAPLAIGLLVGAASGYFGGWVDRFVMRVVDIVIAFPFLVFLIAIVAVFGVGLTGVYVGLIAFGWANYARLTRAEMLVLREQQYVLAARTLGLSHARVILRHAVPNLLRPNLVYSMAGIVLNIMVLASLSYLGLGVQPPQPEWGAIIADGQTYLLTAWWITTLPGLVVVLVGVGFSLIGDGLADRLGLEFRIAA
jgi:peptide/nickel transport system permease protein